MTSPRSQRATRISGLLALLTAVGCSTAVVKSAPRNDARATPGARSAASPAMLWAYVARCALRADQTLEVPPVPEATAPLSGGLGLAPEWRDGTCDAACQEKVSSCLLALTNRTGKHVPVALISSASSLPALRPSENDADFPYQEGTFFGNVFSGTGYACQGADAAAAAARDRFCALAPDSCGGLFRFADAGSCDRSCETACATLASGARRCAAVRCRDPQGHVWEHPITVYLRSDGVAGREPAPPTRASDARSIAATSSSARRARSAKPGLSP